ncbi:MAG: tRNA modification GTPase MnmE [Gemmatimonadaceae bacterium]|nr:tRNA modification GTPase MnmE [Gemmatimonadaceae bacterium]
MLLDNDTIAAVSTAHGRGAIAILRLSGPEAFEIARRVLRRTPQTGRSVVLTTLLDPDSGETIDRVLATRFDPPHSYTGEPLVELSTHGGSAVPAAAMRVLLQQGARQARPGEFTQRAFLAGKLDLVQAEGIAELVDAETEAHRRIALSQVDGGLSRLLDELQRQMLGVEALLAYEIDFPGEDDGPLSRQAVGESAAEVVRVIEKLLGTVEIGQIAKKGASVVIAGVPNAGKSSLLNALAGEERAIVTDQPGTTRDAIEVVLDDPTIPLRLIDTAGLRDTSDAVERLGIEVSHRHLFSASVILACGENRSDIEDALEHIRSTGATGIVLTVHTKSDLSWDSDPVPGAIAVSARNRTGLSELTGEIRRAVQSRFVHTEPMYPVITRTRQRMALDEALAEMHAFQDEWAKGDLPPVIAAVHVRSAVHALNELIGKIDTEAILGAVFERFCIGK